MVMGRLRIGLASSMALAAIPASAVGQVAPESPIHVTANSVFNLCPILVRSNVAPDKDSLAKLGLQGNSESDPQKFEFKAIDNKGLLVVNYDSVERRCTLNYAGPGYQEITGIIRDVVVRNKLTRLTGGDKDGAKADVYEGNVPGNPNLIARFIIIENYTKPSATISYTERTQP
jgi:hypothetical protein